MAFYNEIASILLGDAAAAVAAPQAGTVPQPQQQTAGAEARGSAGDQVAEPAGGGAAAAAGGKVGGSGDSISSRLSVRPEQAAEVIRLIEVAMQSSKERRTIRL
jgi:hypothetical protein